MKMIAMLGTRNDTMGGVSAVINVYASAGLFNRQPIEYIATHMDGGRIAKLSILARAAFRFWGLLVRGRVALVHVHVASRASFWRKSLLMLPAFLLGIPVILHLHGAEFALFYEKECGSIRKQIVCSVFNKASRVVVLSSVWKSWVQGISRNPHVVVIYNPVLLPVKHSWDTRKHGEVLFLGRLGKRKGTYDLLEAAARLARNQPQFRLLLGGDGELDQVWARAIELHIADKVELLGWIREVNKERYLASAMIFALPSYNEGLPMSVLEAMAAGLPVISTPVGGIPEAVTDGIEGFLVEPGDVSALANRLEQLLSNPELAEHMGKAARRKIETAFSAETILPQLEKLYTELGVA